MQFIKNKIRVVHFPQVGSCKEYFAVDVKDEEQAYFTINVLANQHLWLEKNNIIPNYSNAIFVEMFDEDIDEETGKPYGWVDYWNDEECMEWDGVEDHFETVI